MIKKISLSEYVKDVFGEDVEITGWMNDRYQDIKMPEKQDDNSYIVYAPNGILLDPGHTANIYTGIVAASDFKFESSSEFGLACSNIVKINKEDGYHIQLIIENNDSDELSIKKGDQIGKLIPC